MQTAQASDDEMRVIALKKVDGAINCKRRKTLRVLEQNNVPIIAISERKRGVLAADLQRMLDNLKSVKQGVE